MALFLTRRQWLTAAALAPIARSASAVEAPRPPLGFSLYGTKSLPTAEALNLCKTVGYEAVELCLLPGYSTEPAKLTVADRRDMRKRLTDHGLSVAGLMENLPEPAAGNAALTNLDRLKAACDLGRDLMPDQPPPVETVLGGKPSQWEQVKDKLADRLAEWAAIGAAAKTVIAVKPHVANALHTPTGALWLIQRVNSPWLRLAYDFSHFRLRGLDLAETVAALAPLSAFVHVKDARGTAEKFEFLLPGEGDINYRRLFAALAQAGWRGPVVVEVSGMVFSKPGYDPAAAARKAFAALDAARKA